MRRLSALFILCMLFAAGCAEGKSKVVLPQPTEANADALAAECLALVNEEREANLLPPLQWDERLATVAREYAMSLANNNRASHYDDEGRGISERLAYAEVAFVQAGENIARGYTLGRDVVTGWMDSEEHRKNILDPDYTHTGIAVIGPGPYWVEVFVGR